MRELPTLRWEGVELVTVGMWAATSLGPLIDYCLGGAGFTGCQLIIKIHMVLKISPELTS